MMAVEDVLRGHVLGASMDARFWELRAADLQRTVDRLTTIIDRQAQEHERIRLALRLILTVPMREWVGPVLAEAQRTNADVV